MSSKKGQGLRHLLRQLSKKGFPEILVRISETDNGLYYNEILNYAFENKLVRSRASVTTMLNSLTRLGLLERQALTDMRPMRTRYRLSKKGRNLLTYLNHIESEIV